MTRQPPMVSGMPWYGTGAASSGRGGAGAAGPTGAAGTAGAAATAPGHWGAGAPGHWGGGGLSADRARTTGRTEVASSRPGEPAMICGRAGCGFEPAVRATGRPRDADGVTATGGPREAGGLGD